LKPWSATKEDELTEEDRRAIAASREYFGKNADDGISFDQIVNDLRFTMAYSGFAEATIAWCLRKPKIPSASTVFAIAAMRISNYCCLLKTAHGE